MLMIEAHNQEAALGIHSYSLGMNHLGDMVSLRLSRVLEATFLLFASCYWVPKGGRRQTDGLLLFCLPFCSLNPQCGFSHLSSQKSISGSSHSPSHVIHVKNPNLIYRLQRT